MVLENSKTTTFCFAFYLDPSSRSSSDHTVPKTFSGLEMFQNTPRRFPKYGRCCVGGWRGTYISRYGRCCFEIWEVLCWGGRGAKVSRYGRCCFEIWEGLCGGWEDKHFEIWEVLFRDMRDAVSIYERCCFEIWEVLFRDMGGAD